jgi:5-methylcytosine-specific restriction endonuclease McrA
VAYEGETKREYQREWMRRRRDAWLAEHGPCAHCGSDKDLQVDHIDPDQKLLNPAGVWSLSAEKREAELAKCQVLCESCHKIKTAEYRAALPPHGSRARYARKDEHKCRCSECRAANAAYARELRAAHA